MSKAAAGFSIILITSAFLYGCGSGPDERAEEPGTPHYSLTKVDPIGIELGDTLYVFGHIRAAGYLADGNVFVGDLHTFTMSLYDPTGEYIGGGGGQGEGPGEYNMPASVTQTPWGGVVVSDVAAGKLIFFNSDLSLDYEVHGFGRNTPQSVVVLPDSAVIGSRRQFDRDAGRIGVGVYRWEAGSHEESVTYHSNLVSFDVENISETFEATQVNFAASPDGRVFVSPISRDEYLIYCYDAAGELTGTIERPFDRVRRTQEDMDREIAMMEMVAERRGRGGAFLEDWEPDPYHQAISGLDVVGEDQLWVRRGSEEIPFYDVYDLDGEVLFTCSAAQLPYSMEVAVDLGEAGFVAYLANPEDYPRVWLLEMLEGPEASD